MFEHSDRHQISRMQKPSFTCKTKKAALHTKFFVNQMNIDRFEQLQPLHFYTKRRDTRFSFLFIIHSMGLEIFSYYRSGRKNPLAWSCHINSACCYPNKHSNIRKISRESLYTTSPAFFILLKSFCHLQGFSASLQKQQNIRLS